MGLWSWLRRLFGKKERMPTSLVLLFPAPRYLDEAIVRDAVRKAFDIDLSDEDTDAENFVVGHEGVPTYVVQMQGQMLLVNNLPMPYFEDCEATAKALEMRLAAAVRTHRAWLSVDILGDSIPRDAYHILGKLIAEFVDDDCLAILAPALNLANPWEPSLQEKLRGPEPLDAVRIMSDVPVIFVRDDDPRMKAAIEEAKRRWPEFVTAFERRKREQKFAVKATFREGEASEAIWVGVEALENEVIYGTIENNPLGLKKIRLGSRVHLPVAEIQDWLFTTGNDVAGGFSIKVVAEAAKRLGK